MSNPGGKSDEMNKIEEENNNDNNNNRQVILSKRRDGLLKKANELAVLCDCQVAVILFSNTGVLHEFSSCRMNEIITRYLRCTGPPETSLVEHNGEEPKDVDISQKKVAKRKSKQRRLLGTDDVDLDLEQIERLEKIINDGLLGIDDGDLDMEKLGRLEKLINDGLVVVQERKEKLLKEQQLEQSRLQEQQRMLEREALRKEVMNVRDFFPPTEPSVPYYLDWHPMQGQNPTSVSNHGAVSSDIVYNFGAGNGDSDTTLQLGLPYHVERKRKEPEKVTKFQHLP